MYVKRYVVRRGRRQYVYLRLVEAFRDEQGRVRHRVLHTLGREDQLKASGQLDQLAAAFTRLDPPLAGTRREVGPLLLVGHYLDRLGLVALVDRHLPQRGRAQLTHGEVVAALVANRLCAPSPLYDVAGWGSSAAMAEVLDTPGVLLGDDRLGRTLEALAPLAEEVRGAVMLAAIDRFGVQAARLHLDLTCLRVAGAYEGSALVAKGWGPDRRVARQVRMLQATTPQGIALYVRPHPGDAAELACIGAALDRLRELLPPGLLVCADSVLGHVKNLCAADRAGLRFVVPLRADTGFAQRFLDVAQSRVGAYQQPWGQQLPEPVQGGANAGQLGGITRVGAHVQGDPLGGGGLQHADLAGHPPVRPPALGDQRGALVGAGHPQAGQVQVQPGGLDPEAVDRGQHDRPADLLGQRGQRL